MRPRDAGKRFRLVRRLGLAGPYPRITAIIMACPLTCHFVIVKSMSTQKGLFNIFDIRKGKPGSDTDLGDDTQVKKHRFCPKWLEEFQWLKYDSPKNKWLVLRNMSTLYSKMTAPLMR